MGRNVQQTEPERQHLSALSPEESPGWGAERSTRRHEQGLDDHGHAYYSQDAEDAEEMHSADAEHPAAAEAVEEDTGQSPDDPLGLYLRQMGAIPLLNRKEELELSQRLEKARQRYRHAALLSWQVLDHVVDTFEHVLAGQLAVDPTIDVVTSLNLSREQILKRMPFNVRTLRHLLTEAAADFRQLLRASTPAARNRLRKGMWRRARKATVLAGELSPRIELLERWTDELAAQATKMSQLDRQIESAGRSRSDREERTKRTKEL